MIKYQVSKRCHYAARSLAIVALLMAAGGCGGGGNGDANDSEKLPSPAPPVLSLFFTAIDPQLPGQTQLFGTTPDGSALTRLNDEPQTTGGNVTRFAVSANRQYVAYRADLNVDETFDTYFVAADGTGESNLADTLGTGVGIDQNFEWGAAGSRLAYTTLPSRDLYVHDIAGNTLINAAIDFYLWSTNGSKLFYHKSGPFLVNPDGSEDVDLGLGPIQFTAEGSPSMQLSPDGNLFAYWGAAPASSQLHVVNADGTGTVQVSATMVASGTVQDFSWSPDSGRLLYLAGQTLYASAFDGTSNVAISGPAGGDVSVTEFLDIKWSPDGTRAAYLLDQDTGGVIELFVSSVDGMSNVKVSGPLVADGDVREFEWSFDSSQIAYLADQDIDEIVELYISSADGMVNRRVAPLVGGGEVDVFRWSPDGTRLAYIADQVTAGTAELFVSNADGSGNARVNAVLPMGGSVAMFRWSPAGDQLAYLADQVTTGVVQLYTIAVTGGAPQLVSGNLVGIGGVTY